jgi:hypothetical protein
VPPGLRSVRSQFDHVFITTLGWPAGWTA